MIEMCAKHQAIRDKRVGVARPDLMAYIDLKKETAGSRVWASGNPQGELSFDPLAVREHFFKAQAALCLYANGCTAFTYVSILLSDLLLPFQIMCLNALSDRLAFVYTRMGELPSHKFMILCVLVHV